MRRAAMTAVVGVRLAASVWNVAATVQWRDVGAALCAAKISRLILAALLVPLSWMIRAIRWQIMLRPSGVVLPFWDLYMAVAVVLRMMHQGLG